METPDGRRAAVDPAAFAYVGVWIGEVAGHFDPALLFARGTATRDVGDFVFLPPTMEFVPLPYYQDLRQLGAVARAALGTMTRFWRELPRVDTVWIIGPHPFGLPLAGLARLRGKRVVLGVRQDTLSYFRARLPSPRWGGALILVRALDTADRLLARRLKTVVTAPEIAQRYGGEGPRLLVARESVVSARDVVSAPPEKSRTGIIELLTVGRLDPEKNPTLLVEVLAQLEFEEPGRFHLVWVGGGPSEHDVRRRAAELGVGERIDLRGWVPYGPALLDLYRRAHVFVHVSLTEGIPKVLIEALAVGCPVVATDVGGVRGLLDDGRAGLLVPPSDAEALVQAIRQLVDDEQLSSRLVSHGLELVHELTIEARAEAVARFIAGDTGTRRSTD